MRLFKKALIFVLTVATLFSLTACYVGNNYYDDTDILTRLDELQEKIVEQGEKISQLEQENEQLKG